MNFLTIEKFSPHARSSLLKKMMLVFVWLVVPLLMVLAWAWYNLYQLTLAINRSSESELVRNDDVRFVTKEP